MDFEHAYGRVTLGGASLTDIHAQLQTLTQHAAKEVSDRFQQVNDLVNTYEATLNDEILVQSTNLLDEISDISEVTDYEYSNERLLRRIRNLSYNDDIEYHKVGDLEDAAGEMLCKIDFWNRSYC